MKDKDEANRRLVETYRSDCNDRIMTVYRKGLAGPTSDVVTEAQSYQTGLLPGFVLPLSQLLARADSWSRAKRARRQREDTPKIPPAGGTDG